MKKIKVSVVGGSGYTGGEMIRLLLNHPNVEIQQITSESYNGKPLSRVHPNLRGVDLKFCSAQDLEPADLLFLCLPHGQSAQRLEEFTKLAAKLIDLSADFRLNNKDAYLKWYGHEHPKPEILTKFVYGIPELHREEMKQADYISSAGCNATAVILGLFPLIKAEAVDLDKPIITEAKVGSSEGGVKAGPDSHHPVRSRTVRSFQPTGHRHSAEMLQELKLDSINFSATAVELVRGILATSHVFLKDNLTEKDIWQIYRQAYKDEPFLRLVKESAGSYRYPEPKLLQGTNYCEVGFELDQDSRRLVVISAIDNLMKGAAGQAVQAFNLMFNLPEETSLTFRGLHPV